MMVEGDVGAVCVCACVFGKLFSAQSADAMRLVQTRCLFDIQLKNFRVSVFRRAEVK